jgi:hypothetical protein
MLPEDENDDELRIAQARADAALARHLQEQENVGRVRPTGRLTHVGYDDEGRELLVDEVGVRFVRPVRPHDFGLFGARDKKPKAQPPPKEGQEGGDAASGDSEKKCVVC